MVRALPVRMAVDEWTRARARARSDVLMRPLARARVHCINNGNGAKLVSYVY